MQQFLYTFRYFCTPHDFLHFLLDRINSTLTRYQAPQLHARQSFPLGQGGRPWAWFSHHEERGGPWRPKGVRGQGSLAGGLAAGGGHTGMRRKQLGQEGGGLGTWELWEGTWGSRGLFLLTQEESRGQVGRQ